jgi:hypothetical protein
MSTEKNTIIQSCIDVDLMDIKNIANMIEEYTVEYDNNEDPNALYYYRDYMRRLFGESLNNVNPYGQKGLNLNINIKREDRDLYHDLMELQNMLLRSTSRFRRA